MELQALDPQEIIAAGQRTMLVFGAFVLAFVAVIGWAMVRFFSGGWRQGFSGRGDFGSADDSRSILDGGHGSGGNDGGGGGDGGDS